jgi:hypothetical protein
VRNAVRKQNSGFLKNVEEYMGTSMPGKEKKGLKKGRDKA